ncbi:NAD-dependent epimerase/dehydratase family protein [Conchiformibius kuhniae]|uniref:NAD-dependent epimerase/dehydratase family protein n=1 Tax=Conchiformibius kuhniae TaxID=211502 RepID=A0A8T9MQG4_9NEIS|nr:NAD-dependent epimerase/dehydratase family protein [Conchiformibius kuhniae]
MKITVLGGTGFIGARLVRVLRERGHKVRTPSRREVDFLRPDTAAAMSCFAGCDAVVNTVGVMSRHAAVLETVHHHTPKRLAQAARDAGVKHWVQLSALGADASHAVDFVGSKGRGDAAVAGCLNTAVLRPSVVYGRGGASCELFIKLARLPVLVLPNGGNFMLQPVHVADVADGLANLCEQQSADTVNAVGAQAMTLAHYLNTLRHTLHGKPAAAVWPLPLPLLRPVLPLAKIVSNGFLSPDSIALLEAGSCADSEGFAELLARTPLAPAQFAAQN